MGIEGPRGNKGHEVHEAPDGLRRRYEQSEQSQNNNEKVWVISPATAGGLIPTQHLHNMAEYIRISMKTDEQWGCWTLCAIKQKARTGGEKGRHLRRHNVRSNIQPLTPYQVYRVPYRASCNTLDRLPPQMNFRAGFLQNRGGMQTHRKWWRCSRSLRRDFCHN